MRVFLAIAFFLTTTASAFAEERLNEIEEAYVVTVAGTLAAAAFCDAKVAEGGINRMVDRVGIPDHIVRGLNAALNAQSGASYERSDLIPEVTQVFRKTYFGLGEDIKAQKAKTCPKLIDAMRKSGTVE
jgi:hypothetical protein